MSIAGLPIESKLTMRTRFKIDDNSERVHWWVGVVVNNLEIKGNIPVILGVKPPTQLTVARKAYLRFAEFIPRGSPRRCQTPSLGKEGIVCL